MGIGPLLKAQSTRANMSCLKSSGAYVCVECMRFRVLILSDIGLGVHGMDVDLISIDWSFHVPIGLPSAIHMHVQSNQMQCSQAWPHL